MRTVRRQVIELNQGKAQALQCLVGAFADEKRFWLDQFARRDHRDLIARQRQVRDAALKAKYTPKSGLQARMWKLALADAAQTWDMFWQALFVEVRRRIGGRTDFDAADRHYAFWLLSSYEPFFGCLDGVAAPPKFAIDEVRRVKVAAFIRRRVKRMRGRNPMLRTAHSAVFDANCYSVFEEGGTQYVKLMGLEPGKRIVLPLLGRTAITGNIRLVLGADGTAHIHVGFDLVPAANAEDGPIVALDTGYTEAFVDTKGNAYGAGLGAVLSKASDERNASGKARNRLRALAEKAVRHGNPAKARRINRNNLGSVKWDRRERKARASIGRIINTAINEFVAGRPGAIVVTEDLRHTFTFDKSRAVNRRLSAWVRGALQDRVQFKALAEGFRHEQVSAAYSSQTCPICGFVDSGNRKGDRFVCIKCGTEDHADRVGALNIESRLTDPQITRFTPYPEVKAILLDRFHRRLEATETAVTSSDVKAVSSATVPGRTPDTAPSALPRAGFETSVLTGEDTAQAVSATTPAVTRIANPTKPSTMPPTNTWCICSRF